jgi:uncharacterized membrane protein
MQWITDCGDWLRLIFLVPSVIFFLIWLLWRFVPAKKINMFYGYRTFQSMKNQTMWDAAQRYSSQLFRKMSLVILVVGIIQMAVFRVEVLWFSLVAVIGVVFVLIATERYLKRVDTAMQSGQPIPEE